MQKSPTVAGERAQEQQRRGGGAAYRRQSVARALDHFGLGLK
jgi:hypothetical protein